MANVLGVVTSLAIAVFVNSKTANAAEYVVNFKGIAISGKERVVGFDLTAQHASIVSVRNVPVGWQITLDNEPSWQAEIRGSISVGAAAVDWLQLNGLLTLTDEKGQGAVPKVSGEIVVTEYFEHEHHILLEPKNISLEKVEPRR